MLLLRRTAVVNMPTARIITDLLLPLQELLTQGKLLHLGITMNGALLIHLIHQTTVIITLTLMIPIFLAAPGTNMMRRNREILKIGAEVVRLMKHAMGLRIEAGDSNTTVALLHHHTRSLFLGRL